MGTKYATILVGGVVQTYNDGPPADDGSQTEANRVKYVTVTGDLTAPLHSAITSMDGKLTTFVDEGPTATLGTYTTDLADHNTIVECSGTFTLSLLNPTGNAGYKVTAKNAGSGTITVNVDGGANVDGAASISLGPGEARDLRVNAAGTVYYSATGRVASGSVPSGTVMVFYQATAPIGWTLTATPTDAVVTLDASAGGTTGGTGDITAGITSGAGTSHTHSFSSTTGAPNQGDQNVNPGVVSVARQAHSHDVSGTTGGESAHTHSVSAKYAKCILATKD